VEGRKGTAIGLVVLASAGIGAALTTSGTPGVPPTALGLAALVAIVLAAAAWLSRETPSAVATALLLVALAAVAAQDSFRADLPRGHDVPAHAWAVYATWRAALDGDPFPRWTPYLGLGMPLLQFYGPLPWMVTWPAQALGATPGEALKVGVVLSQCLAAGSTYVGCRWLRRSPAASLVAAAALVLGPYRLLDLTFRFAYAEAFAMALLPALLAAAVLVARGERATGRLAVLGGLVLLCHPVTGLLLVPVSVIPLAVAWWSAPDRRAAARSFVAAVALALGATAAWWVPMAAEQSFTTLDQTASMGRSMGRHGAWPEELLLRRAWTGYDLRRQHRGDRSAQREAVPLYFGWGLVALSGLALATRRRRAGERALRRSGPATAADRALWEGRAWVGGVLVGLMLAAKPTAYALDLIPLSGRIQFPWRFLSPATACAALAASFAIDAWAPPGRRRAALAVAALALLAFDAAPSLGAPGRLVSPAPFAVPVEGDHLLRVERIDLPPEDPSLRVARSRGLFPEYSNHEIRARYADAGRRQGRSEFYGVSWRARQELHPAPAVRLDGRLLPEASLEARAERLDLTLPEHAAGQVVITVQHFPGWRASVDGGPWADAGTFEGLLAVDVPASANTVRLRYSGWLPLDRTAGKLLSLLTLALVVVFRRSGPAAPSEPQ